MIKSRRALGMLAGLCLAAASAQAKVVFTGYGDFRYTPLQYINVKASPALLDILHINDANFVTRGARLDSVGVFATTNLSQGLDFLMDVTYRQIGPQVNDLSLQYAYLNYALSDDTQFRAGKITLPFGYLNQNKFYPFQRVSITAPIFPQGILGLPIADIGASAAQRVSLGPVQMVADIYAVNGYGPIAGSTSSFRNGSLPGALTIANNLGSRDANNRTAWGGRLAFSPKDHPDFEGGVSYYGGQWDPQGQHMFQMGNVHLHAKMGDCEFLSEYTLIDTAGDDGFASNIGTEDWRTEGFFAMFSTKVAEPWGKPLIPWIRYENYVTRGLHGQSNGHEKIWEPAGGLELRATENLSLKLEVSRIYYYLPFVGQGAVKLYADSYLLGATFTF